MTQLTLLCHGTGTCTALVTDPGNCGGVRVVSGLNEAERDADATVEESRAAVIVDTE